MRIEQITATDLPDSWFQAVYRLLQIGRDFTVDKGSMQGQKRLEYDYVTIHIKYPCSDSFPERLPKLPAQYNLPDPVNPDYVFGGPSHKGRTYIEYLMTAIMLPNESYTYGQRLTFSRISSHILTLYDNRHEKEVQAILHCEPEIWENTNIVKRMGSSIVYLNGIELAIHRWKSLLKQGKERDNQIVLQVAQPDDLLLKDPPCQRAIDTRIQDGKLHFFINFRSWDLWGGYPANLAAASLLMEYMASNIGVEPGEFVCCSKGLHLYSYVWELAECIRGKTIEEFRKEQ